MNATPLPAAGRVAGAGERPRLLSWPAAVLLHLAPGAALLLFFLLTAPALQTAGLPPVWALLFGTVLVILPLEVWLGRRLQRRAAATGVTVLPLGRIGREDLPVLLAALVAALLAPGAVVWLEPIIHDAVLSWLPGWFTAGPSALAEHPPLVVGTTVVLWLITQVIVGPVIEEVYFRGRLLPLMPGGWMIGGIAEAGLFSLYHLWQPQAVLTILVFTVPLVALAGVQRKTATAVVVHVTVNLLAFVALFLGAAER
ncbi:MULTISPECIES: CPBP family glutamic-type intramembrane protease [Microbacterium]|uniref:CPBP family glutamic-type intramembrane protease n=1 Tax=Microbacterium TaxID=33882 RepID=UPI00217E1758|nr:MULTISPECIES: CPBP family glutamic-type intramembrane protease [Microbacterium]UWF76814.1 CPBP family intramembrane metalloprotease [Microbacterium neungamense]WCM54964.1 CPBP family intramembrane metalloprotease [Microbacterium sp. EF45047]